MIADLSTGEQTDPLPDAGKDPAAVERGRLGGLKGGPARYKRLSDEKRREIARRAAKTRWSKK
jgi:hypothetical protein